MTSRDYMEGSLEERKPILGFLGYDRFFGYASAEKKKVHWI